jgi:hypothetical protein
VEWTTGETGFDGDLYRGITECYDIQLIDIYFSTTVLFILYKVRLHVSTIQAVILRSLISFKS